MEAVISPERWPGRPCLMAPSDDVGGNWSLINTPSRWSGALLFAFGMTIQCNIIYTYTDT